MIVQEVSRLVHSILVEWQAASKKLTSIKSQPQTHADIVAQIEKLVPKRFLLHTPYTQLAHFPRYFKAMVMRMDKLRNDAARDAQMMRDMQPLLQNWQRTMNERAGAIDERLMQFRWLVEELRVGLFAQELRTPMPVSVKRLHKVWDSLQR